MAAGELSLHFLGTGGGRHTMSTQRRRTAGIRVTGPASVHIDPGPGALVHSIYSGLPPLTLDGVVVTHSHPDHYTDAEVLVEAITRGTTRRRGILAGPRSVLEGNGAIDSALSRYHRDLPAKVEALEPGSAFTVKDLRFTATPAIHGDPDCVGLVVEAPGYGRVGYTSDTEYSAEVSRAYAGCRLLVLCTVWPRGERLEGHLNTDDALRILNDVSPQLAVTTHYGQRILNADPAGEAAWLAEASGVPVYAAVDGLTIRLGEKATLQGPRKTDRSTAV